MNMSKLRTGYSYHEIFGWHDTGTNAGFFPSDPALGLQPFQNYENAETKRRIHELIVVSKLIDELKRINVREATTEELLLVHPQSYLTQLKKTSEQLLGGDAGDGRAERRRAHRRPRRHRRRRGVPLLAGRRDDPRPDRRDRRGPGVPLTTTGVRGMAYESMICETVAFAGHNGDRIDAYNLTGTPCEAIDSFTSRIENSPKWKTLAASTASASASMTASASRRHHRSSVTSRLCSDRTASSGGVASDGVTRRRRRVGPHGVGGRPAVRGGRHPAGVGGLAGRASAVLRGAARADGGGAAGTQNTVNRRARSMPLRGPQWGPQPFGRSYRQE